MGYVRNKKILSFNVEFKKTRRIMKKLFRIMGLCALVALAFGSCKKNETKTFKASTVQLSSDSRTHLNFNRNKVLWDANNWITVYNQTGDYRNFQVSSLENGGSTAVFHIYNDDGEFMEQLDVDNSYQAYYPNVCAGENPGEVVLSVPAVQTFSGDNFADNSFPMKGKNLNGAFTFSTDAGILMLQLQGQTGTIDIDSLMICAKPAFAESDNFAGKMVYRYDDPSYYDFVRTGSAISLAKRNGQTITIPTGEGAYLFFSFILPKGALANGFFLRGYYGGTKIFEKEAKGDGSCVIIEQSVRFMDPLAI